MNFDEMGGALVVVALREAEFFLHLVLQDDRFDVGDAHGDLSEVSEAETA